MTKHGEAMVCKNTINIPSVLTAKQRKLYPTAQVATCIRIARRAEARAEWLTELLDTSELHQAGPVRANALRQRDAAAERCRQACDEVIRIVQDNPTAGWTREQRAYCASQEVER